MLFASPRLRALVCPNCHHEPRNLCLPFACSCTLRTTLTRIWLSFQGPPEPGAYGVRPLSDKQRSFPYSPFDSRYLRSICGLRSRCDNSSADEIAVGTSFSEAIMPNPRALRSINSRSIGIGAATPR